MDSKEKVEYQFSALFMFMLYLLLKHRNAIQETEDK